MQAEENETHRNCELVLFATIKINIHTRSIFFQIRIANVLLLDTFGGLLFAIVDIVIVASEVERE